MTLLLDKLLIDKTDLADFREISSNIAATTLNIYIREAQTINLKTFLGGVTYKLLLDDYTVNTKTFATQKYTDLFFGSNYTNKRGESVRQNGLAPALIYFTYSRFLLQHNVNVGRYGVSSLNQDTAETSSSSTVRNNSTQANAMALTYQSEVGTFLNDKETVYPEWQKKKTHGQKIAAPFFKV